jgi:uncharacterized protein with PIN domain
MTRCIRCKGRRFLQTHITIAMSLPDGSLHTVQADSAICVKCGETYTDGEVLARMLERLDATES